MRIRKEGIRQGRRALHENHLPYGLKNTLYPHERNYIISLSVLSKRKYFKSFAAHEEDILLMIRMENFHKEQRVFIHLQSHSSLARCMAMPSCYWYSKKTACVVTTHCPKLIHGHRTGFCHSFNSIAEIRRLITLATEGKR